MDPKRSARRKSAQQRPVRNERTASTASQPLRKPDGSGRLEGAALVIVLAFLLIITGLVVAFLSSVTNEATATSASAAAVSTRSLSDATIQLTIAQIRDATAGFARNSDGTLDTTTPLCWASQPGAIRTYDGNASNIAIYKLYSSTNLVTTSDPSNDLPPSGWISNAAVWTDLNSPVVTVNKDGGTTQTNTNYPIMDPALAATAANTTNYVDGFTINTPAAVSNSVNTAPMPVVWIYQLRDGTLIPPDSSSTGGKATFAQAAKQPTSSNPIIGRIAFWSDDETCKLNVNTASEGSFWGVPSFASCMDANMSLTQPTANEYNRFPGHPASTSLSPVLWSFLGMANPSVFTGSLQGNPVSSFANTNYYLGNSNTLNSLVNSTVTNFYTNLFANLTPRYAWGGSAAGVSNTISQSLASTPLPTITNLPTSRLYSSVDEYFFAATNLTAGSRTKNAAGLRPIDVSRLRFFLTAQSRAPEVNPQNLPKIAMWPVPDSNNKMTANPQALSTTGGANRTMSDKLIAFCSTLGTNAYYFTRYDSTSTANDCSSATTPRNANLYIYLRSLLDQSTPGFQGGFTSSASGPQKWTTLQADQISTLLFDYIRSCVNLVDSTGVDVSSVANFATSKYPYSYTTPSSNSTVLVGGTNSFMTDLKNGTGQVIPIFITNPSGTVTRGMGRFPNVRAGTLWMIARAANQPPLMVYPDGKPKVYNAAGTEISTYAGGVSSIATAANQQIVLSGLARAAVNPLHPWISPVTNAILQLMTNVAGISVPVMSDYATNLLSKTNDATKSINTITNLYPVFALPSQSKDSELALSANTGNKAPYLCYPTVALSNQPSAYTINNADYTNIVAIQYPVIYWTNAQIYTNFIVTGTAPNLTTNTYTNCLLAHAATSNGRTANGTNISGCGMNSHPGLPFIPLQNPVTGGFDITNTNCTDMVRLNPSVTTLPYHATYCEAVFFPELVNVAPGQVGLGPNLKIQIEGLNSFAANGTPMGFPSRATMAVCQSGAAIGLPIETSYAIGNTKTLWFRGITNSTTADSNSTPFYAAPFTFTSSGTFSFTGGTVTISLQTTNSSPTTLQKNSMDFPSATFPVPMLGMNRMPYLNSANNYPPVDAFFSQPACTYFWSDFPNHSSLTFSNCATNPWLTATNYWWPPIANSASDVVTNKTINAGNSAWGSRLQMGPLAMMTNLGGAVNMRSYLYSFEEVMPSMMISSSTNNASYPWYNTGLALESADTYASVECLYGDTRLLACLSNIPTGFYTNNPYYGYANQVVIKGWPTYFRNAYSTRALYYYLCGASVGFLCSSDANATVNHAEYMNGAWQKIPTEVRSTQKYLSLTNVTNLTTAPNTSPTKFLQLDLGYDGDSAGLAGFYGTGPFPLPEAVPTCDFADPNFSAIWKRGGDFDSGFGLTPDGPFINKVDEGIGAAINTVINTNVNGTTTYATAGNPYFAAFSVGAGSTLMSPNRQIPSPVVFGSLPVGFGNMGSTATPSPNMVTNGWLTLQFSPNPNSPSTSYLSTRNALAGYNEGGSPITNPVLPDHLLLDYFWMPVVAPYPISDPFSTAGKVNMNCNIAPFSYITRDAALRGVLKSVMITAIPEGALSMYKTSTKYYFNAGSFGSSTYPTNILGSYNTIASNSGNFYFHYPIHATETLRQFTNRFGQGDLFHSPSEICSIWLYPAKQPTAALPYNNTNYVTNWVADNSTIKSWWYDNPGTYRKGLTGDNLRERPYNYLYPRLTTKSNTYQVHYRVQTLKQTPTAHPSGYSTWIDPSVTGGATDKILSELRGSAIVERYIDPADPKIPDFAGKVASVGRAGNASSVKAVIADPVYIMDTYYRFRVINAKQFTP